MTRAFGGAARGTVTTGPRPATVTVGSPGPGPAAAPLACPAEGTAARMSKTNTSVSVPVTLTKALPRRPKPSRGGATSLPPAADPLAGQVPPGRQPRGQWQPLRLMAGEGVHHQPVPGPHLRRDVEQHVVAGARTTGPGPR